MIVGVEYEYMYDVEKLLRTAHQSKSLKHSKLQVRFKARMHVIPFNRLSLVSREWHRINKQLEVIALEQLTLHIERRPTASETRVAYDNSTWRAINTRYIHSTKETSSNYIDQSKNINIRGKRFELNAVMFPPEQLCCTLLENNFSPKSKWMDTETAKGILGVKTKYIYARCICNQKLWWL